MKGKAVLAIDVGTGSVRAAFISLGGKILGSGVHGHESDHRGHGVVQQSPMDWWFGVIAAVRRASEKLSGGVETEAIVCCGQMHAPVLIDHDGRLVESAVPLWNDKRAATLATRIASSSVPEHPPTYPNVPTSAWPGIKLAWMADNRPELISAAATLLMPKDFINFKLTGERATDWTEAGCSFMADVCSRSWDRSLASTLNIPERLLPPIRHSTDILGELTQEAAHELGLLPGTPVFAGAGDFPAALLGSGVTFPGQISDITGTSFLLTTISEHFSEHPDLMNVPTVNDLWGTFALVDAAGDAVQWARRALGSKRRSYASIVRSAMQTPAGAGGLLFLPYLTGERLGQGDTSRASFVGLTAGHDSRHMHRAVLEGVVFAMREAAAPMLGRGNGTHQVISAAGGARSLDWLQMKADILNAQVYPVVVEDAGLVGCAAIALAGLGVHRSLRSAAGAIVRYRPPVRPIPENQATYERMFEAFLSARINMQAVNTMLSKLS